ncbi:MAG: hypothetical protein H0T51_04440, partial [Pirellulales bacterium]|nr:hypothetical protein [Pirellulales bacterium]
MNSLFGLLAAPSAATTALDAVGQTADAASAPFELLMEMAMQNVDASAGVEALGQEDEEAESLEQQLAEQLQALLESLGVQSDDRVTIEVDNATGDLSVAGDHPLAAEIEAALHGAAQLEGNIRRLAARDGLFGAAPFAANSRLEVELAE